MHLNHPQTTPPKSMKNLSSVVMVSTRLETAALRRRICRLCVWSQWVETGLFRAVSGSLPTLHRTFVKFESVGKNGKFCDFRSEAHFS